MPSSPRELRALVDEMKAQRASQAKSSDARDITAVALKQNWAVFDLMNTLLQTEGELSRATYELAACLKSEHNVWYAEIRFCAALHTLEGLTQDEAVGAVVDGLRRACATVGLRGGIILCALRSHPAPHPLETAKLARRWLGHGVVGFDVAGSETYALSLPAIVSALEACSEWGVPTTVHAGELPRGMLTNLRTALRLGVDRIGHGLALCVGDAAERGEDAELLAEVAGQDVLLEVCLTSNCTPSRVPSYAAHPVRRMFDAGVKIALSVDNLTLSGDPVTAAACESAGLDPLKPRLQLAWLPTPLANPVA